MKGLTFKAMPGKAHTTVLGFDTIKIIDIRLSHTRTVTQVIDHKSVTFTTNCYTLECITEDGYTQIDADEFYEILSTFDAYELA